MRQLFPLAAWMLTLTLVCDITTLRADETDDGPRLLDASILEETKQVLPAVNRSTEPEEEIEAAAGVSPEARSSLSRRLQEIRRRAVDDDISRAFQVGEPGAEEILGELPEVRRKPLNQPAERTARVPRSVPRQIRGDDAGPQPTPARRTPPQAGPSQPATPETVTPSSAQPEEIKLHEGPDALNAVPKAVSENLAPIQQAPSQPRQRGPVSPRSVGHEPQRQPVGIPADSRAPGQAIPTQPARAPSAARSAMPETNFSAPTTSHRVPTSNSVSMQRIEEPARDVLMTNRAPALSFETHGPKTIKIGQEATYRVTMVNSGDVNARNLVVTVQLPAWTEVTGHSASVGGPHLENDAAQNTLVRWHLNELPARGREHLQLKIVPRDSRPFDLSVGWAFAQGQSMTQIEVQEPRLDMEITGPDEVLYGETETYTIALTNPGTGDADGVVLQLMPLTPHQQSGAARNFGVLKAGERKSVALELTAHQAGRLHVQAVAVAEGGLRAEAGQEVVVRRANLEVTAAGPTRTFAGTEGVYRLRLENTGDATAQESAVVLTLPAGAKYLASNDGGKFDAESGQVAWHVGPLRPGAVRLLELRSMLSMPGENRFEIRASGEGDLTASHTVATQVEALADLKLYVNDPKGAIPVGAPAVYEVRVVNRGTRAAENVEVVGYFSEGIEPEQVQGWRGTLGPGQVVFEPIGVLAAGQELVFRITARAGQAGNHVFRAEVQCSSPETKLAMEEWTKYYGDAAVASEMSPRAAAEPSRQGGAPGHSQMPTLDLRR